LKKLGLGDIPQALIAHEITSPLSLWPHLALYAMAHRIQWRGLIKEADRIGVSTEAWINRWIPSQIRQSKPVYLSPSPSNIPVVKLDQTEEIHARNWRLENGLPEKCPLLLFFGSMGGPKQLDWVLEAWRTARKKLNPNTALTLVGGNPQVELTESEKGLFRSLGYLSSRDVSLAFQAADVITLPFLDGVSERRGSFMSGLAHGKVVATTLGPSAGPTLRNSAYFVSSDYRDSASYVERTVNILGDPQRKSEMGAMARLHYHQFMDWPIVWNRLTRPKITW
jgi:glycosyltransferase involved in cell wall biosynthesis